VLQAKNKLHTESIAEKTKGSSMLKEPVEKSTAFGKQRFVKKIIVGKDLITLLLQISTMER
jgi:hypothetical protein